MHWGGRGHAGLTTTVDGSNHRNAQSLAGPIFSEDSMSLVLMQDHRRSGRSILYDSRVARRSASGGSGGGNSGRTGDNRGRTGGNRGVSDNVLGDMIFGSVPMNMPSVDTKIHDTADTLVVTLVFGADPAITDSISCLIGIPAKVAPTRQSTAVVAALWSAAASTAPTPNGNGSGAGGGVAYGNTDPTAAGTDADAHTATTAAVAAVAGRTKAFIPPQQVVALTADALQAAAAAAAAAAATAASISDNADTNVAIAEGMQDDATECPRFNAAAAAARLGGGGSSSSISSSSACSSSAPSTIGTMSLFSMASKELGMFAVEHSEHRHLRWSRSQLNNLEFGLRRPQQASVGLPRRQDRRYALSLMLPKTKDTKLFREFLMTHFAFVEQTLQRARARLIHVLTPWSKAQPSARRSSSTSSTNSNSSAMKEAAAAAAAAHASSGGGSNGRSNGNGNTNRPGYSTSSTNSSSSNSTGGPVLQHDAQLSNAVMSVLQTLKALFTAPRLRTPAWLDMNTFKAARGTVAHNVSRSMVLLLGRCKRVGSDMFLSQVLTAVLSNHVGWIASIIPTDASNGVQIARCSPASLQQKARAQPYDPLWAQLNDLVGATTTKAAVCRTVVVGEDAVAVGHMLQLLSYFIRCNEVFQLTVGDPGMEACPTADPVSEGEAGTAAATAAASYPAWSGSGEVFAQASPSREKPPSRSPTPSTSLLSTTSLALLEEDDAATAATVPSSAKDAAVAVSGKGSDSSTGGTGGSGTRNQRRSSVGAGSVRSYSNYDVAAAATVVGRHPIVTTAISPDSTAAYTSAAAAAAAAADPAPASASSSASAASPPHAPSAGAGAAAAAGSSGGAVSISWMLGSFGRSLFGHICSSLVPGFVLQGLLEPPPEEEVIADVQTSLQFSAIDRPVQSAACLIINMDLCTVEKVQARNPEASAASTTHLNNSPRRVPKAAPGSAMQTPAARFSRSTPMPSRQVSSMLITFEGLISMDCEADFCMQHVEDRLRELWMQSRIFAAAGDAHRASRESSLGSASSASSAQPTKKTTKSEMMKSMAIEEGDFALLHAVAGSHTLLDDWLDPHH